MQVWSIDWATVGAFALLWAAIVPTPGANSIFVTHVALTHQPRHVALAIVGNLFGILLLGLAALLGMALLLEVFPRLRLAVHVVGGLYLAYFGFRLIGRSSSLRDGRASDPAYAAVDPPPWHTVLLGFLTAVSNAQAIIFITSLLAVTGVLSATLGTGVACVAVMLLCNGSYLAFLGWLFRRSSARSLYSRFRPALEAVFGLVFIALGGRLLWAEVGSSFVRRPLEPG
jgi:threonine/homoserine/homoserine lactone efflux protein